MLGQKMNTDNLCPEQTQKCADESVLLLLCALSIQGQYANTEICCRVKEYMDSGFNSELIVPLVKRVSSSTWSMADNEIKCAEKVGVKVLHLFHPNYPKRLLQLVDPPLVLFIRGELSDSFSVGIVGTRRCSQYGRRMAVSLAKEIASAGGNVISGLAYGVDAAAHEGALSASMNGAYAGVAVLGSGILNVQPALNKPLADRLLDLGGALVSEYGLRTEARKYFFPRRNRIVSGLADAVIVVEAAERSGSLITARLALEQGREVFSVPGQIDSILSAGTNRLLKEGANVLTSVDDVLQIIAPNVTKQTKAQSKKNQTQSMSLSSISFGSEEDKAAANQILELLQNEGAVNFDALVQKLKQSAIKIRQILSLLELHDFIIELDNSCYAIV